jgi:hypothetical protein
MIKNMPFEEMLAQLDEIAEWLHGKGFQAHHRVRQYQRNIRHMLQAQSDGIFQGLEHLPESKRREILWSYVEADEFTRAVVPLRARIGIEASTLPIARALDGPADLYLETQKSSQGRNFMFELIMGGRLAKAGFIPSFINGPDLDFNFRGLRVSVQCKRPFSRDGLEETIRKAISQLKKDNADLSLIAVSVSRLWNSGDPNEIPMFQNSETGQAYLDAKGREIADHSARFWREKLPRAGIFFYGFTPVCWPMPKGTHGYASLRAETMSPVMSEDFETKRLLMSLVFAIGS